MEILSPAGSPEVVPAAVMSGADALYLGASAFNARINANNFTDEELKKTIGYCHERGVRVYATVNTLITDRELPKALELCGFLTEAGIDAFIVQDLGFAMNLKKCVPSVPLHASTQMSVHSLDGAECLAELGFSRVVLARELSLDDIKQITRHAHIETEVFVHGAFCMSYSGQCYMSSIIGGRSGNRGLCAQPCRLPYQNGYSLSLKDNCLLEYVPALAAAGVTSLKIEGRMKGAEYVAGVTDQYVCAKNGEPYSPDQKEYLAKIFSRQGFTDGYFTGKTSKEMFGVRKESDETVRVKLPTEEYKRFPLDISVKSDGETAVIGAECEGLGAEASVPVQKAEKRATSSEEIMTALSKLGNTPYFIRTFSCGTKEDDFIPVSLLNAARRDLTKSLTDMRVIHNRAFTLRPAENVVFAPNDGKTGVEGWFRDLSSVPGNAGKLSKIWLYAECFSDKKISSVIEKYGDKAGISLPPVYHDSEKAAVKKWLDKARELGVKDVLCGNIGQIFQCRDDFAVYGDYGLNVFNAQSVGEYQKLGCRGVTLSFELSMRQCEDLCGKDTGIIAYGRLPFMVMRNCVKGGDGHGCERKGKNLFLTDRMKKKFLLTCDIGCRNRLWNADKLWLADKALPRFGFIRLLFTDETAAEAEAVIEAYTGGEAEMPEDITRGRYY